MPNGHGPKEYGPHKYADNDGTSNCAHHCGCWMGPTRSGGPIGLDPGGLCPGNPVDGKLLGGTDDYEHVINERISSLQSRVYLAETKLKQVAPGELKLAEELEKAKRELSELEQKIKRIDQIVHRE